MVDLKSEGSDFFNFDGKEAGTKPVERASRPESDSEEVKESIVDILVERAKSPGGLDIEKAAIEFRLPATDIEKLITSAQYRGAKA